MTPTSSFKVSANTSPKLEIKKNNTFCNTEKNKENGYRIKENQKICTIYENFLQTGDITDFSKCLSEDVIMKIEHCYPINIEEIYIGKEKVIKAFERYHFDSSREEINLTSSNEIQNNKILLDFSIEFSLKQNEKLQNTQEISADSFVNSEAVDIANNTVNKKRLSSRRQTQGGDSTLLINQEDKVAAILLNEFSCEMSPEGSFEDEDLSSEVKSLPSEGK